MPALISNSYAPEVVGEIKYQWQDDAACLDEDPETFFPAVGDLRTSVMARDICAGCPVIAQCRELGMQFDFGIFGGTTPRERSGGKGRSEGSKGRQKRLLELRMPTKEVARICGVSERTVQRTQAEMIEMGTK